MNIKKAFLIAIHTLLISVSLMTAQVIFAADTPSVQIVNPLCADKSGVCDVKDAANAGIYDPRTILGNIIKAAMGFIGAVALVLFMYGGLTIMISSGSSEAVKKGKNIMIWAALGIIVIFSSYAIVSFLVEKISKA